MHTPEPYSSVLSYLPKAVQDEYEHWFSNPYATQPMQPWWSTQWG